MTNILRCGKPSVEASIDSAFDKARLKLRLALVLDNPNPNRLNTINTLFFDQITPFSTMM
jgi:hypothetical protein